VPFIPIAEDPFRAHAAEKGRIEGEKPLQMGQARPSSGRNTQKEIRREAPNNRATDWEKGSIRMSLVPTAARRRPGLLGLVSALVATVVTVGRIRQVQLND